MKGEVPVDDVRNMLEDPDQTLAVGEIHSQHDIVHINSKVMESTWVDRCGNLRLASALGPYISLGGEFTHCLDSCWPATVPAILLQIVKPENHIAALLAIRYIKNPIQSISLSEGLNDRPPSQHLYGLPRVEPKSCEGFDGRAFSTK